MDIRLTDKVALITGATSGIGEATARVFAACGARLALTGRNREKLQQLQRELHSDDNRVFILAGDIRDAAFRQQLIQQTVQQWGRLDILVNSAGIIDTGTIESTDLDQFDRLMDVNLRSVFHLMQLAIPHLEKSRGNIVNVSSVAGLRSFPGILAYCVSKAGLDQLTRCAALELAPRGIRVNAVNPGVVKTRLHLRSAMDEAAYAQFLEHSRSTHPLGRVGTPEEVAELIAFLASEHAGWITGVTYSIDGGRAQTCAR
ncbi:MAG: glucose 1-dehydrogenase [Calditrichaeota bacterium]|nr:glucose 1-dehydrogenase [Calditrichota bacterium]